MAEVQDKIKRVNEIIEWCKKNNYPYKIHKYSIFWQTSLQTGEINVLTNEVKWHKLKYFNRIKG